MEQLFFLKFPEFYPVTFNGDKSFELTTPNIKKVIDKTIAQYLIGFELIRGQIAINKNTIQNNMPKLLLFDFLRIKILISSI